MIATGGVPANETEVLVPNQLIAAVNLGHESPYRLEIPRAATAASAD
jgi:hypothetical protein